MRKYMLALLAGVLLALTLATAAFATTQHSYDKHPPKHTIYYRGEAIQVANRDEFNWYYFRNGETYRRAQEPDHFTYPKPDTVQVGKNRPAKLRIRINKPEKPYAWGVRRSMSKKDAEEGRRYPVESTLSPIREKDGTIKAWQATIRLKYAPRHYYLFFGGEWDQPEKDVSFGFARFTAHIKTK